MNCKLIALATFFAFAFGAPAFAAKPEARPEVARTSQQAQPSVAAKPEARPEVRKAPKSSPEPTVSAKPEARPE